MRRAALTLALVISMSTGFLSHHAAMAQTTATPTVEELQARIRELEAENQQLRDENQLLDERLAALSGGGSAAATTSVAVAETPTFGVGESFSFETWNLTVTNVSFSPTAQGSFSKSARGVYVIVELAIINESNAPTAFPYDRLQLKTGSGQTFNIDTEATIDVQIFNYGVAFYDALQPGLFYTNVVLYDIPPDAIGLALTTSDDKFVVNLGV